MRRWGCTESGRAGRPWPSCRSTWAGAGQKQVRRAILGGSALSPPPAPRQGHRQPVGNSPCSPRAKGFSPQQGLGPDQQTLKMGPFLPHSKLRNNFLFRWQNPPWSGEGRGDPPLASSRMRVPGDKYLPRVLLVQGPGGQNPVNVVLQLLAHSASRDPNLSQLIRAPPLLRAGLLCTHLLPGGEVGGKFWVGAACPRSSDCQQPQVHRKPVFPLLCRQAHYKSSFSRGSLMLREYQMIQNRRLKAMIRDPE